MEAVWIRSMKRREKVLTVSATGRSAKNSHQATLPFLTNLSDDPMLSHTHQILLHANQKLRIGRPDAEEEQDLQLEGLGIGKYHCIISRPHFHDTQLQSCCDATYVNGVRLTRGTMRQLHHADAIVLGVCAHVFVFVQPAPKPGQMRTQSLDLVGTGLLDDGLTLPGAGEGGDGSLGGFRPPSEAPMRSGLAKGGSFNSAGVSLSKSSSGE